MRELGVLLEEFHQLRHVAGDGFIRRRLHSQLFDPRHQTAVIDLHIDQSRTAQPLDHDLDVSRGKLQMLDDSGNDSEREDVVLAGFVDLGIPLRGEEDLFVGATESVFQRDHRRSTADHKRRHHVGKDHHVP